MTWAILDLETTGLSPWPAHEPWEATLLIPDADRWEITWQLPVDLGRADTAALRIGRYHERRWQPAVTDDERRSAIFGMDSAAGDPGPGHIVHPDDMHFWAAEFARLTRGLALASPSATRSGTPASATASSSRPSSIRSPDGGHDQGSPPASTAAGIVRAVATPRRHRHQRPRPGTPPMPGPPGGQPACTGRRHTP